MNAALEAKYEYLRKGASQMEALVTIAREGTLNDVGEAVAKMPSDDLEGVAMAMALVLAATPDAAWANAHV